MFSRLQLQKLLSHKIRRLERRCWHWSGNLFSTIYTSHPEYSSSPTEWSARGQFPVLSCGTLKNKWTRYHKAYRQLFYQIKILRIFSNTQGSFVYRARRFITPCASVLLLTKFWNNEPTFVTPNELHTISVVHYTPIIRSAEVVIQLLTKLSLCEACNFAGIIKKASRYTLKN
jgi:hypothetical protein